MKLPSSIIHELVRTGGSTLAALRILLCVNELLFGVHEVGLLRNPTWFLQSVALVCSCK